jgi:hypothetical protein
MMLMDTKSVCIGQEKTACCQSLFMSCFRFFPPKTVTRAIALPRQQFHATPTASISITRRGLLSNVLAYLVAIYRQLNISCNAFLPTRMAYETDRTGGKSAHTKASRNSEVNGVFANAVANLNPT